MKWGRECIEERGGGGRKGVREEEGRQDCKVRGRGLFGRWRLQPAKVIECILFLPPPPGHPPAHSHQRLEWLDSGQCQVCTDILLFRDPMIQREKGGQSPRARGVISQRGVVSQREGWSLRERGGLSERGVISQREGGGRLVSGA